MRLVPCTVKAARRFVAETHRHLPKVQGGLFAVGIAGNPPRVWQGTGRVVITRVASDGAENACSMIYGALCRAAKALGYREAWTYTLPHELGASLRAAGFREQGETGSGEWSRDLRPRQPALFPGSKRRWMRRLAAVIVLAIAAPLAAQEPEPADWPPPVEEPAEEPEAVEPEPLPGLYLSAWCSLKRGEDDAVATCDQGLAGALASWDPGEPGGLRASWVLFGGAETVGTGGAVSRRISDRVVLGVGAGVVIPIPEDGGLETDDLRLAVGVTASFW